MSGLPSFSVSGLPGIVALREFAAAAFNGRSRSAAEDDADGADAGEEDPSFSVRNLPGIVAPLGFFDPAGFSKDASEGRIKFFREVELKVSDLQMGLACPLSPASLPRPSDLACARSTGA